MLTEIDPRRCSGPFDCCRAVPATAGDPLVPRVSFLPSVVAVSLFPTPPNRTRRVRQHRLPPRAVPALSARRDGPVRVRSARQQQLWCAPTLLLQRILYAQQANGCVHTRGALVFVHAEMEGTSARLGRPIIDASFSPPLYICNTSRLQEGISSACTYYLASGDAATGLPILGAEARAEARPSSRSR